MLLCDSMCGGVHDSILCVGVRDSMCVGVRDSLCTVYFNYCTGVHSYYMY